jgi:hypothetical protein
MKGRDECENKNNYSSFNCLGHIDAVTKEEI